MEKRIGIRLEDKNERERRAPLTPEDVGILVREYGIPFAVESSEKRVFPDETYRDAGADIVQDISHCPIVLGVKEMPEEVFRPETTYVFFSHTIKGQPYNMAMLRKLKELKCSLIDYEKIEDENGRRLVFFGRYAGLAGMIDGLWMLGKRLEADGYETPLRSVRQAMKHKDLHSAKEAVARAGRKIDREGLPDTLVPFVVGFAGYGHVSQGAQEIFDEIPHRVVAPEDLAMEFERGTGDGPLFWKVVFHEEHMVEPEREGKRFVLQEYYDHPERYSGAFRQYLPYLSMLVNCIFWTEKYPRLVTKDDVKDLYLSGNRRFMAVSDITCDPGGSVACTTHCTDPGDPYFVYDVKKGRAVEGVSGDGPAILAVDNLPCELPEDASAHFSGVLRDFIPALAECDFTTDYPDLYLPEPLKGAMILHRGRFAPGYGYMRKFLKP